MKKHIVLSALASALLPFILFQTAVASDWRLAASGADNDPLVYVDTYSISRKGNLKKAWFRYDYQSSQNMDFPPFKQYQSMKELDYYNCTERTMSTAQRILYTGMTGSGGVVFSASVPVGMLQFDDVTPDTIGESMLNFVCRHK